MPANPPDPRAHTLRQLLQVLQGPGVCVRGVWVRGVRVRGMRVWGVSVRGEAETTEEEEEAADAELKTRTPHRDVGNKSLTNYAAETVHFFALSHNMYQVTL